MWSFLTRISVISFDADTTICLVFTYLFLNKNIIYRIDISGRTLETPAANELDCIKFYKFKSSPWIRII